MTSGILTSCVLLFIIAIQTTNGKAATLGRQKRAPINSASENVELDPAYKAEYVKLFVSLLQDAMRDNPSLGQVATDLPNFLAYPRSGRSSPVGMQRDARAMMFGYPRLGRSGADAEECCQRGIKSMKILSDVKQICPYDSCCNGLKEIKQIVDFRYEPIFTLCVSEEFSEEKNLQ